MSDTTDDKVRYFRYDVNDADSKQLAQDSAREAMEKGCAVALVPCLPTEEGWRTYWKLMEMISDSAKSRYMDGDIPDGMQQFEQTWESATFRRLRLGDYLSWQLCVSCPQPDNPWERAFMPFAAKMDGTRFRHITLDEWNSHLDTHKQGLCGCSPASRLQPLTEGIAQDSPSQSS